jgi:hypothetical protein
MLTNKGDAVDASIWIVNSLLPQDPKGTDCARDIYSFPRREQASPKIGTLAIERG